MPFQEAVLTRTKGGKPFLVRLRRGRASAPRRALTPQQANPPPQRSHAPNWNFNVSHEGAPLLPRCAALRLVAAAT